MNATPHSPFTPPEPDSIDPDLLRDLAMLKQMAELAMDLAILYAGKAHAQAAAEEAYDEAVEAAAPGEALPEPPPFRDFGAMFGRAARTARQAIALKSRLKEGFFAVREKVKRERDERLMAAEAVVEAEKAKRRRMALDIAGASLTAAINADDRKLSGVMTDLYEKLNDDEAYDELAGQSAILLAQRLCKDLGIEPIWGFDPRYPWRSPAIREDDEPADDLEDDDPEDDDPAVAEKPDGESAPKEKPGPDDGADTG